MQTRRSQLRIYILSSLLLAFVVWKKQTDGKHPVEKAASKVTPELSDGTVDGNTESAAAMSSPGQSSGVESSSSELEPEWVILIENFDPMNADQSARTIGALRALPPEKVSAFLVKELQELGHQKPADRDRLVMLANGLQSPADLPFWENLALRKTPRYENEEKLRNPIHPTLESRSIDMEQLQAIRNLGLIANQSLPARRILMQIILNPDPTAHRTLHREQAYIALREADLSTSLRVLKRLPVADELLKRI